MLNGAKLFYLLLIVIGLINTSLSGEEPVKSNSAKDFYTDGIAASVNGEIITHSELDLYSRQFHKDEKFVLQSLIKKKLVLQTAKKENVKISDEELDKRLDPVVNSEGGKEEFEKKLRAFLNISYEKYREDLREEMIRQKYVKNTVNWQWTQDKESKLNYVIDTFVSPKEIRDYFEGNKSLFAGGPKIKVQQIVLAFEDDISKNNKRVLAEALLTEINKGANFSQLASRFSVINAATGGVSDYLSKEYFPAQVNEIIFKLRIDEVSPLMETEKDYRIVKILDKIEGAENADSPDLQSRIKKILFDKKLQDGLDKLGDDLVKKADIWVDPAIGFSWNPSSNTALPPASQK